MQNALEKWKKSSFGVYFKNIKIIQKNTWKKHQTSLIQYKTETKLTSNLHQTYKFTPNLHQTYTPFLKPFSRE